MRKLMKHLTLLAVFALACLNAQCQKAEIHKNDGTTVEVPTDEIDSITFSMTNPFNFETRTVKLNSGYEMPIIGIGTFYLSTSQAEESVYNALKVGMRLRGQGSGCQQTDILDCLAGSQLGHHRGNGL